MPDTETSSEADDVRDICRRWSRALATRNSDRIGQLLADRCVLIPPNGDSIKGPGPVVEAWGRFFSLPGFHLKLEPYRINLYSTGETAHDVGRYQLALHADSEGRRSLQDHGSHLLIWERSVDGRWRVRSDVFFSLTLDGPRLPRFYPSSADGKST